MTRPCYLFPYENHDPFRVFLPILFRVLLKRLGFPRVIIGYACAHTLFILMTRPCYLFPYENHDPFRVFLPILFRVLFRVLLKRLGFSRVSIEYACTHTLFQA